MKDENSPLGDGRLRDEYNEAGYLEYLINRTTEFLRGAGIDIESDALDEALRDSPLGLAVADMRERLIKAEQKNMTDALTGIPNRAGFIKSLHDHITAPDVDTETAPSHIAVAFIDLDGFKQVNDHCGHANGDDALIKVATRFREAFEPLHGVVGRIGGDEMVLFLPSDGTETADIERRIREEVDAALDGLVYWDGITPYPVGASIGVHVFNRQNPDQPGETVREQISFILEQADANMYRDKWGEYNPDIDTDPLKAPKNRRLEALRAHYIREQAPLLHWPDAEI